MTTDNIEKMAAACVEACKTLIGPLRTEIASLGPLRTEIASLAKTLEACVAAIEKLDRAQESNERRLSRHANHLQNLEDWKHQDRQ
jgi:hypothetical protein